MGTSAPGSSIGAAAAALQRRDASRPDLTSPDGGLRLSKSMFLRTLELASRRVLRTRMADAFAGCWFRLAAQG